MNFTKMQGLGNDYLYVYGGVPNNVKELCKKLSDRHFGAGSDGMIFISPSCAADFSMRIFNADGSEAKMCGNGIRCVGKYVYDKGYTDKTKISVETLSGVKKLKLNLMGKKVKTVSVDMGEGLPQKETAVSLNGRRITYIGVNVGNLHAVVFTDDLDGVDVENLGRRFQNHKSFKDGVNVEFAQILSPNKIRMRVYERGSGITMACGTGACAVTVAAAYKGLVSYNTPITLMLDGGNLEITVSEQNRVIMTGPAETVYEGETAL